MEVRPLIHPGTWFDPMRRHCYSLQMLGINTVVQLNPLQIVTRALYLAGERDMDDLDEHVRRFSGPTDPRLAELAYHYASDGRVWCPDLYYLLENHNGGIDPCAPDPAVRWKKPNSTFTNRTVDCSGGNAWMHGFSRFQDQFPLYRDRVYVNGKPLDGGWINTDSKILDARGRQTCFVPTPNNRPEIGTIITCMSGSPGHGVGHEGTVVAVHCLEWDPKVRELWDLVDVVDCAKRDPHRTNRRTTARGWYGTGAMFLRSIMTP